MVVEAAGQDARPRRRCPGPWCRGSPSGRRCRPRWPGSPRGAPRWSAWSSCSSRRSSPSAAPDGSLRSGASRPDGTAGPAARATGRASAWLRAIGRRAIVYRVSSMSPRRESRAAGGSQMSSTQPTTPSSGARITHLVLTVRDIEASHRFYTEIIGYEQCGLLEGELAESEMRFYRASTNHHDLALVQVGKPERGPGAARGVAGLLPRPRGRHQPLRHRLPDAGRRGWRQLEHMQANGRPLRPARQPRHDPQRRTCATPTATASRSCTTSRPEIWEGDVNAALNYFEVMPSRGPRVRSRTPPTTSASPTPGPERSSRATRRR